MKSIKRAGASLIAMLMAFLMYMPAAFSQEENYEDFRVVGYYFEGFEDPIEENVQFERLTHIIYAFLIPNDDGSLIGVQYPQKLEKIVKMGHDKGVNVILGVGGWSYKDIPLDPTFEKMASSDDTREKFVENVIEYVDRYDLDGVDMDWEYPDMGQSAQNYEKLIISMSDKLRARGKTLTAAVPGSPFPDRGLEAAEAISDNTLQRFDWINIMAYDADNGPGHSPYEFTENSIAYWTRRGIENEKRVIGVPFYARPSWKLYRDLIAADNMNAFRDSASSGGVSSYYNGIYTMREKTRLALNRTSGVMIWEINMDTLDEHSLHKVINDTIAQRRDTGDSKNSIYLRIDGKEIEFGGDAMGVPFADGNSRTLMPVRKALEEMGISVKYDTANRVVKAQKDDIYVDIPIGEKYIVKMEKDERGHIVKRSTVNMDTVAVVKEGRTYVPARYIFETFGYSIAWHEGSRTVIVTN